MGNRLSKIYTRTGDDGTSALSDGKRLSKDSAIFDAIGDVDELNSQIGMILAHLSKSDYIIENKHNINQELTIISHLLFNVGGELAMPEFIGITNKHITWLERSIDGMNEHLPPLKNFILPKGNLLICQIHIARTTARRTERTLVKAHQIHPIRAELLQFINRLSDYLFVLARFVTPNDEIDETLWDSRILAEFE